MIISDLTPDIPDIPETLDTPEKNFEYLLKKGLSGHKNQADHYTKLKKFAIIL